MELTKKTFDIYPYNEHVHCIVVKSSRLASKVNKYLKSYYPADTKFKEGDECLFKVPNSMLSGLCIILGVKG